MSLVAEKEENAKGVGVIGIRRPKRIGRRGSDKGSPCLARVVGEVLRRGKGDGCVSGGEETGRKRNPSRLS